MGKTVDNLLGKTDFDIVFDIGSSLQSMHTILRCITDVIAHLKISFGETTVVFSFSTHETSLRVSFAKC